MQGKQSAGRTPLEVGTGRGDEAAEGSRHPAGEEARPQGSGSEVGLRFLTGSCQRYPQKTQ